MRLNDNDRKPLTTKNLSTEEESRFLCVSFSPDTLSPASIWRDVTWRQVMLTNAVDSEVHWARLWRDQWQQGCYKINSIRSWDSKMGRDSRLREALL